MLNVLTIQAHDVESVVLTETQAFHEGRENQFWSRDLIIIRDNGEQQKIALYSSKSAEALTANLGRKSPVRR